MAPRPPTLPPESRAPTPRSRTRYRAPSAPRRRRSPRRCRPRTARCSRCPTRARRSGTSRTRRWFFETFVLERYAAGLPAVRPAIPRASSTPTTTPSASGIRGPSAACCRGPSLRRGASPTAPHVDDGDGGAARAPRPTPRRRGADRARPAPRAAAPGADPHRRQAPAVAQPAAAGLSPRAGRWRRHAAAALALARASPAASSTSATPAPASPSTTRRPRHRVFLAPFALASRPVTQRRVRRVHRRRRLPPPRAVAVARLGHRGSAAAGRRRSTGSARRRAGDVHAARAWSPLDPARAGVPRQLLRGRRLRPLGRRAAADRVRVGGRPRAGVPVEGNFAETGALHPLRAAPDRPRGGLAQLFGDVLGVDRAAPTRPTPAIRPAAGRGRRVQRQVHVQPVRAARRLLRHAARRTSARPTATSSRRTRAGSSPACASRATPLSAVRRRRTPRSRRARPASSAPRRSPRRRASPRTPPARTCTNSRCGSARRPRSARSPPSQAHRLRRRRLEVHFDASGGGVVEAAVRERLGPEVAAQHAVDVAQHVAVERRGDADRVVVGGVEPRLVLLRVDADQEAAAGTRARNGAGRARRKPRASSGSKLPIDEPG